MDKTPKLTSTEIEFNDIEDGKGITIRKGYRPIKLGLLEFESLEEKRKLNVQVTHVIHTLVRDIPMEYVKDDGFLDKHDLVNQLTEFYPDIDELSEVTIVTYYLIRLV